MGSSDSSLYDLSGNILLNRKCIVLLTPPSFEISKFLKSFPNQFNFKYVSVGQLIRDQINKKTKYSQIILDHLEQYKKVNDKILEILLKNTALQGNFMIQFCPKNQQDFIIWSNFLKQIQIQAVIIINSQNVKQEIPKSHQIKQIYAIKLKQHIKNIQKITKIVSNDIIYKFNQKQQGISQKIIKIINNTNNKNQ